MYFCGFLWKKNVLLIKTARDIMCSCKDTVFYVRREGNWPLRIRADAFCNCSKKNKKRKLWQRCLRSVFAVFYDDESGYRSAR